MIADCQSLTSKMDEWGKVAAEEQRERETESKNRINNSLKKLFQQEKKEDTRKREGKRQMSDKLNANRPKKGLSNSNNSSNPGKSKCVQTSRAPKSKFNQQQMAKPNVTPRTNNLRGRIRLPTSRLFDSFKMCSKQCISCLDNIEKHDWLLCCTMPIRESLDYEEANQALELKNIVNTNSLEQSQSMIEINQNSRHSETVLYASGEANFFLSTAVMLEIIRVKGLKKIKHFKMNIKNYIDDVKLFIEFNSHGMFY